MAVLHIDEYTGKEPAFSRSHGRAPDTVYPQRITTQPKITTSGSSQQSAVVNVATAFVSIRPVGGAVYIELGMDPVASESSKYIPDGAVYDVAVKTGYKVAVINA